MDNDLLKVILHAKYSLGQILGPTNGFLCFPTEMVT